MLNSNAVVNRPFTPERIFYLAICALVALGAVRSARATENGASTFPVGVETVMTGMYPHPGKAMFYEYTAFYEANKFLNGQGQSAFPEFKLRVFATAIKYSETWHYKFLGGNLNSNIALPIIYQQLHVVPGKFEKYSIGNVDIVPVALVYHRELAHWYCEADAFMPGTAYSQNDVLNIGQHNLALGPVCGITILPNHGKTEFSARNTYLFNGPDRNTKYHSGNEYFTEFNFAQALSKKAAIGLNGFIYQQTTDDKLNMAVFQSGFRGRDLGIGPQLRFNLPHGGFAFKYLRDTLVQNKPQGNAFWFQIAVPFPAHVTKN